MSRVSDKSQSRDNRDKLADKVQTLTLNSSYDAIVIGAGIAGCISALLAARDGLSVLMVDAKSLGRDKVCGGCLNQRAWGVLQRVGLADSIGELAVPLNRLQVRHGAVSAQWRMPTLHAISRRTMDPILVEAAQAAGVTFVDQCRAMVIPDQTESGSGLDLNRLQNPHTQDPGAQNPHARNSGARDSRLVELHCAGKKIEVAGSVVVAADGLGHPSLARLNEFQSTVANSSYVGIGGVMSEEMSQPLSLSVKENELLMACSSKGYVGICGVEKRGVNIAAAVAPDLLSNSQKLGSRNALAKSICHLVEQSGVARSTEHLEETLNGVRWLATPRLTRRANRIVGRRIFLVGDSVGYVEPFTGEGMAWAMQSAELLSTLLPVAVTDWSDTLSIDWQRVWRTHVQPNQRVCRRLSTLLRWPTLTKAVLPVAGRLKNLPAWLFPQHDAVSCSAELRQQMETA